MNCMLSGKTVVATRLFHSNRVSPCILLQNDVGIRALRHLAIASIQTQNMKPRDIPLIGLVEILCIIIIYCVHFVQLYCFSMA